MEKLEQTKCALQRVRFVLFGALAFAVACNQNKREVEDISLVKPFTWPESFPQPEVPTDNQIIASRIALGEKLFYEKALSIDSSLSCSSCHLPQFAFTDGKQFSVGFHGMTGTRNAQGVVNLAWITEFFRDGGSHTLEMQVQGPVEAENEMAFNMSELVERLKNDEVYQQLAKEAYAREFDAWVLTRALAAYQRSLVSSNSYYDKWLNGDAIAMTESQIRGKDLFFGNRTQCASCHSGFNFTDNSYRNIGLYKEYPDTGRARITGKPEDSGKFRVPSLRNVELTAPYMHDGSMQTLEEVVRLYERGGELNRNRDELIRPIRLTTQEREDLVNFMRALTDTAFVNYHVARAKKL